MTQVVTFEFEAGAVCVTEIAQCILDRLEGIGENEVSRHFEKFGFPVVFPFTVFLRHSKDTEIQ